MVIVAFKPEEKEISKYEELDQYDYGQILRIQGLHLPPAVEIHFALQKTGGTSKTRIGITKDGVTDVPIPDSMLENGDTEDDYSIYAFIYITDETSGQTEYRITLRVKARPKPEVPGGGDNPDIFHEVMETVRKSMEAAAESERQAEGWAHGSEGLPERLQDNAKYYSEQAREDSKKTDADRKEVERLVESVSGIDEQVTKVENLTKQAQTSATNSALSEQAAKESENDAAQSRAGAEAAENNAELAAQKAEQDKAIVEQTKNLVKQMGQEVLDNKNLVDKEVEDFALKAQQALADVNNAGQTQTERVQSAGTTAVENIQTTQGTATEAVETTKSEAVQAIQTEGTTQTGNVTTEGTKQVQAISDKGKEVLQSIPEDFQTQIEAKLDKNQGAENAGKALVVGEDGNVIPGEVQGGTVDLDPTLTQSGKAADAKVTGDKILQFAIKNTMQGESPLVVPDSAEEGILGFGLTGKTEQATTKGSNLCDKSAFTLGVLGANGQVSPHTNMYVSDYIPVKSSAQYTRTILGDASNHFYDIDKQHITNITNTPFTVPENAAYCRIMATKNLFETNDLMFNEGTKILPYEPYTGGKPSPSPEYSQEIVSAGKWNEEKQKYEVDVKVTGKNLFDRGKAKDENNWIFKDGDGYARFQIHVKKGNKITFSYTEKLTTGMRFYLGISQSEISSVVTWLYHDTTVSFIVNKHTITATNDYIYLMCTKGAIQTFLDVIKSLQVEISPDQTEYQPYKEQTLTLTSDRPITKWDKLVEQDGQIGWQYSGKIITLTGNEEWISDLNAFYTRNYDIKNGNNPLCSHYVNKSIVNQEMDNIFSVGDGAYENSLWIRDTRFSTVQDFSAYLLEMAQKGTPITVIASSKTESPEFVPLPQEQQESIRALTTYYPTTVIGTDGGELNTDAELSYVADTKNFILGQIAEIAKKQLATDALILERTV